MTYPYDRFMILAKHTDRREKRRKDKPEKKWLKKDIPSLLKKAQVVFNRQIRERDSTNGRFICISCGKEYDIKLCNAGHYVPQGANSYLRFNEDNTNAECVRCNLGDAFHLIGYRKNLILKIGIERVEFLEANRHSIKKWTVEELIELINKYS